MYKIIISVLVAACASVNVYAQGTSTAAKGNVPSSQDAKTLSAEPVTGSEDHKVKNKLTDSAFVQNSAMMGMAELAISRQALKKGATKATRDFATMMVKSLTAMHKQLHAAAAPSGISVPDKLDPTHAEAVSKLAATPGSDFDQNYIGLMKQDLDSMVALFENAAGEQSLSEELRNFATKTLDTLRNHQLLAHNLAEGKIDTPK